MRRRTVLVGTMVAALLTTPVVGAAPVGAAAVEPSPRHLVVLDAAAGGGIDDLVGQVLGDAVGQVLGTALGRWATPLARAAMVDATFERALTGFTVQDASAPLLAALRDHPSVVLVEADRPVSLQALPTGVDRVEADRNPHAGLGSGRDVDVDVAVIDTGVAAGHPDLRVATAQDCRGGCRPGGGDTDGHGTHVAGIVAARDDGSGPVGVAPGARIWSLKVLDGLDTAGSALDVVAALDFVVRHADQIEVANISLGGRGRSAAMDRAVEAAVAAGVTVVVAAGNDGVDAAAQTPANSPGAVTVSAFVDTDGAPGARGEDSCGGDDTFASWSNHGSLVDLAAPGGCITSLAPSGGAQRMSGTSMASPHVAGAAAQYVVARGLIASDDRADQVRRGLQADWAVSQHGPCGFTGGVSDERVLHLAPCGSPTPAPAPRPSPSSPPSQAPAPPPQDPAVDEPAPGPEVGVVTVSFRDGRSLLGGRWLAATLTVVTDDQRVDGAEVTWQVRGDDGTVHEVHTETTGRNGTVRGQTSGLDAGCYEVVVVEVRASGRTSDGHTPANRHCI